MEPHHIAHRLAPRRPQPLPHRRPRRPRHRPTRTTLAVALTFAVVALAGLPAVAAAGTVAYEGDTLVLVAAPGERNGVTLGGEEEGRLSIADEHAHTYPADRCSQLDTGSPLKCELPKAVRVDLGDGNDTFVVDHLVQGTPAVEVHGGAGDDRLAAIAGNTRLVLDGGAGADALRTEEGDDVLRGGPGADRLAGGAGDDVLEGGEDDDTLSGDACGPPGADVLDGGPGHDLLTDWGDCGPGTDRRRVTVTVDGVADDGRPGEGDDVRDLDALQLFVPAEVVGTDDGETVEVFAAADREPSSIHGRGGADDLRTGTGRETIDGGAGDDRIEGGDNHDILTGGPGRDVIFGDSTAGNCGGNGQGCTIPFGNDTIDAADGEADQIDCGAGEDAVKADAADVIAPNCERITGATRPATGPATRPVSPAKDPGSAGPAARPRMTLDAPRGVRGLLRTGVVARLAGYRPGSVRVTIRLGRRSLATRRVEIGPAGRATVRVAMAPAVRRSLSARRSLRLTVSAGPVTRTLTVGKVAEEDRE